VDPRGDIARDVRCDAGTPDFEKDVAGDFGSQLARLNLEVQVLGEPPDQPEALREGGSALEPDVEAGSGLR